ncbi:DExH-box ATP-dependent RNA helicase DExH9 [Picochlorum sp. SENEW3]|nr:DExH-box ATP-dependent RNA helicase DExH9 [Picochlorum sp. SENEW3]WPT14635.1 DExH-box ATP-dependent RNA helicase DExH9 [Picochlorum sp. SENEW3]
MHVPEKKRKRETREEDIVIGVEQNKKNVIEMQGKSCLHEVAWPPGKEHDGAPTLPPAERKDVEPARQYPFQIDPFQQIAINCMEAGHSVLVAAHTSAGKTVVAEYAFAMALRDGARVVYTSPLKALSNQKYREFQEKFGDVGLITGDVVINPSASCLVMTTEILRSMLYRGSEVIREVSLVVYDEIHYLRDKERGVVWEESIILAPKSTRFAFLSATLPNARDFAEWIATTHDSPCHVVYTDYRPTPLQHFLYPAGGEGIYLVVDERNAFREDSFSKAIGSLEEDPDEKKKKKKVNANGGKEQSDVNKLINMIVEKRLDPVIIFSFSKNECESLADQVTSLDVNSSEEKEMVRAIYDGAVDVLSENDRKLPEVVSIIKRIERGIGVHHSGMLPILKELTEILFQEGLIKVLFATETFSTGLNMPAKTVVFTHARKFDGGSFRWISSGEYTQMSGRAGRRGLDDKGTVILMIDSKMDPATAKDMLRGTPDPLYSEFHLTYPMLINMLRVEGANVEDLIQRSYRQFQSEKAIPMLEQKRASIESRMKDIVIDDEHLIQSYAGLLDQYHVLEKGRRDILMRPKLVLPFLQPGRLILIEHGGMQAESSRSVNYDARHGAWAAVINFEVLGKKEEKEKRRVIIDVLAMCDEARGPKDPRILPSQEGANGVAFVVTIDLDQVLELSTIRVHLPADLRTKETRAVGAKVLKEVAKRFGTKGPPLLDAEKDIKVTSDDYFTTVARLDKIKRMIDSHPVLEDEQGTLLPRLQALREKADLKHTIRMLDKDIQKAGGLVLEEDLRSRTRVLQRLGYIDKDHVISTKAKAAAEISTGDELVLCELIFSGVFSGLKVDQVAALISCFIWREKSEARAKVPHEMEGPYASLRDAARRIARAESDCHMGVDVDEYVDSFKPDLMAIVIEWCHGATFAHIASLAGDKTHGGSLVRAIRRLEELLRQVSAALKLIGDVHLAEQFDKAIEKIKRDIIFAASLFL